MPATGTGESATWDGVGSLIADVFDTSYGGSNGTNALSNSSGSNLDFPLGIDLADRVGYKKGTDQWHERIENYSPWNDVFSVSQQETELIVDVPFDNRYLFLIYALGYQYVDGVRLRRINPIVHPYWNWMRCARVAHRGVRFQGNKIYTAAGGTARYRLARFHLGFANYPWVFREDKDINPTNGEEITRNTYYEFVPSTQFLAAEGGAAVLGLPYTNAGAVDGATQFKSALGTPLNQITYKLHWKWVPFAYVFKGFVPVNIINAMNTLNQFSFLQDGSMPQGTVRFDTPQITTFVSPIRTGGFPEILCDITLNLTFFDPPRLFIADETERTNANQVVVAGTPSAVRGHNLVPDRATNLWKPATRFPAPNVAQVAPAPTLLNQLFLYSDHFQAFVKPT